MDTDGFCPNGKKLPNRQFVAANPSSDGPLALVLKSPRYHGAEILGTNEADAGIIGAIEHDRTAAVEVEWRLEWVHMLGHLEGAYKVFHEHASLEQTVFQDLALSYYHQQDVYWYFAERSDLPRFPR
jgi:hypothetical protein